MRRRIEIEADGRNEMPATDQGNTIFVHRHDPYSASETRRESQLEPARNESLAGSAP